MSLDWKGFERDTAKALGAWWGCVFRRTPGSGAWGKQGQSRFNKGLDATSDFNGDIVAPPEAKFPFSVECKTYKTVEVYQFLYGKSNIFGWWFQTVADAKHVGKRPMLVMKENRKQSLVVIDHSTYKALFRDLRELRGMSLRYINSKGLQKELHVFDFKAFLEHCPVASAKRLNT